MPYLSARENALHRLGTPLSAGTRTATQALAQGKLDGWNLRKVPLFAEVDSQRLAAPNTFAVVRDSPMIKGMAEIMGDVGASYKIIQNEDMVPLLDLLVEESGATYYAAGELDGGRQAFVTLKLPGVAKVGGLDVVDNYITVIASHDGESSTRLMITPVRKACASTLNLPFKGAAHTFKVRHTSGAHKVLAAQAREALEFTFTYLDSFQEEADRLIQASLPQAKFEEVITRSFGPPKGAAAPTVTRTQNKLDQMAELFSDQYGRTGVQETAWAGLSALTEWHDHYSPVRGVAAGQEPAARSRKALMDPTFKCKALAVMLAQV